MNLSSSLRALAFASVCALPLPAGVLTFNFTETGGNVVVTASGSITGNWQYRNDPFPGASINPSTGAILFGDGNNQPKLYTPGGPNTGTWTGSFGSGVLESASSFSGPDLLGFRFGPDELLLPSTYVIGTTLTPLSSTMTFSGKTFASLGITAVAKSAVYGGDTIQLTFGSGGGSSVPDAGPGPALALLLGGLGLRQWRSSRRARAAA